MENKRRHCCKMCRLSTCKSWRRVERKETCQQHLGINPTAKMWVSSGKERVSSASARRPGFSLHQRLILLVAAQVSEGLGIPDGVRRAAAWGLGTADFVQHSGSAQSPLGLAFSPCNLIRPRLTQDLGGDHTLAYRLKAYTLRGGQTKCQKCRSKASKVKE